MTRIGLAAVALVAGATAAIAWGDIPGPITLVLMLISVIGAIAFALSFEPPA